MKQATLSGRRPLTSTLSRFRSSFAITAALVGFAAQTRAADFNWDPLGDQSNSGGFGIWDLTSLNWNDDATPPNVIWPNLPDAHAIFGGIGGVVAIDTGLNGLGVTVGKVTFNTDGYTLSGDEATEALTFGGATPTIHVTLGTATISTTVVSSAGLTKTGAGILNLRSATGNGIVGNFTVTGGTLDIDSDAALGDLENDILLHAGRLDYSGTVQWDPAPNRIINLGAGHGTIGGSGTIRITDAGQITGSGNLIREGTGSNVQLDLQQPNPTFTGNTIINSGAIEYRNNLALGNAPGQTVTVNGGLFTIAIGPSTGNVAPTLIQPVTLNGGAIGFGNIVGGRYAGNVNVTADSIIQVHDFYRTANQGGTIDGVLSGTGRLTVNGVTSGFTTGTSSVGSVFLRNPANTYSGTFGINGGAHVRSLQGGGIDALGAATLELNGGGVGLVPVVSAAGPSSGFFGRYYNSTKINNGVIGGFDFGAEPMFHSRTDQTVDYAATIPTVPGANLVSMGALWTGILQVTTPGTYVFSFRSDDGSMVYLDGQQVVTNDVAQGATERFGSIHLEAGFHPIIMKYGQGTGSAAAQAFYNGPDTANAKVVIGSVPNTVTNLGTGKFAPTLMDSPIIVATSGDIDLAGADAISAGTITFSPNSSLRVTGVTGFETLTQAGEVMLNGSNTISAGITLIGNQAASHGHQSSGADLVIAANISELVPGSGIIKDGPRKVTLQGTSSFTGVSVVNAGTLVGTTAALPGGVTVNTGGTLEINQATNSVFGGILDGVGTFRKTGTGTVSFNGFHSFTGNAVVVGGAISGTGNLPSTIMVQAGGAIAGASGSTFTVGGLVLGPKSGARFALGAPSVMPQLDVLNTLAASISELSFTDAGGLAAGTYRLIDYTGTPLTLRQFAGLAVGSGPAGFYYGLVNNAVDTAVDLTVETPAATKTWTGTQSGTWDVNGSANWAPGVFLDGEQVVFDQSGVNRVISGPAVNPQSITVNAAAGTDYEIGNAIGGTLAGGLRKQGSNVLKLTGANTFTGGIVVSGGTLAANVTPTTNSLGASNVTLAAGTTLQLTAFTPTVQNGLSSRYFSTTPDSTTNGNTNLSVFNFGQTAAVFQVDTNFDPAAYTETNLPAGGAVGYDEATTNTNWKNFAIERVGMVRVERPGWYSFHTASDDGTRIYINRRLLANANGGHGNVEAAGTVFLTPGLHEFRYEFVQGTGGGDERISWAGPGIAKQVLPSSVVFAAENGSAAGSTTHVAAGTPVIAQGDATLAVDGTEFTGLELGTLVTNGGTVTVAGPSSKVLRITNTVLSSSVSFSNMPDLSLGKIDDLGAPVTITKTGPGRLIMDHVASGANGSVISPGTILNIEAGEVYARGSGAAGAASPLGSATVRLNGGNLILDTATNAFTMTNPFVVDQTATISSNAEGHTLNLQGAITIAAGAHLTIDTSTGTRGSNANVTVPAQAVAGGTLNLSGGISGAGDLTIRSTPTANSQVPVSGTVFLRQAATHTGITNIIGNFASQIALELRGLGRLANTTGVNAPGEIQLTNVRLNLFNNDGGNLPDRVPDAFPISMRSSTIRFDGANAAAANETLGAITLVGGQNNLFGGTATGTVFQTLTVGGITRQDRSTLRLDATNMGATAATNGVRFIFTDPSGFTNAMVGGDNTLGTNGKIIPWAWGAPTGNNRSLVTYDTQGLRFLADTEYAQALNLLVNPTENVRQTYGAAETVGTGGAQTMNSLVVVNTATADLTLSLLPGSTLNVTSGVVMLNTTDSTARRVVLEGGNINFGTAEGIVIASRREHLLRALLSGSNGLTLTGDGSLTLDNASNNFSGDIRVNLGGSPTSTAIGLFIQNDGSLGVAGNDLFIDGSSIRFNTAFTMNANRTVNIGPAGALIDTNNTAVAIAGQVTGSGPFYKSNNNTLTLSNPNNNYTGDTYILSGNLVTNTGPQGDIHHYATDNIGFAGTNRVLTFTQTFDGTYSGDIDGVGDVVKAGTGRVTFTGDHTYNGITTINAGALIVNGSISGSTVTVNAGRLGGNGDIFYNVVVGNSTGSGDAVLAPGDGIGTLTVGGNVQFALDAAFDLQINTTQDTTDLLTAAGPITLGTGIVPLTISDLAPAPLGGGEVFIFLQAAGGISGEFAGLPDGSTVNVSGNQFTIDYSANSVALIVPEPGAAACLLGGLAMLLGFGRGRRNRA